MTRNRDVPGISHRDFRSIVPSTLEECYELAAAIEHEDFDHVAEELGDVLFQVVFYAQLGRERNLFSFATVVNTLVEKLIRRHPHVFSNGAIEGQSDDRATVDSVKHSWEVIKQAERATRNQAGALADIPLALPALSRAQKVQKRAAQVKFDWPDIAGVWDKLQEELGELRDAVSEAHTQAIRDELGDVLFTCVNLARHLGLDAEESLRHATDKFSGRFQRMEAAAGTDLSGLTEQQLDQLWRRSKAEFGRD